jgi:hypothetical protein
VACFQSSIAQWKDQVRPRTGRDVAQAVSRRFSPRRPGFAPRAFRMGFVVDKEALGQDFFRVLLFSLLTLFHLCSILTHASSGRLTTGPLAAAVPQRQSHTIATTTTIRPRKCPFRISFLFGCDPRIFLFTEMTLSVYRRFTCNCVTHRRSYGRAVPFWTLWSTLILEILIETKTYLHGLPLPVACVSRWMQPEHRKFYSKLHRPILITNYVTYISFF